jgi:hypothetical protein
LLYQYSPTGARGIPWSLETSSLRVTRSVDGTFLEEKCLECAIEVEYRFGFEWFFANFYQSVDWLLAGVVLIV